MLLWVGIVVTTACGLLVAGTLPSERIVILVCFLTSVRCIVVMNIFRLLNEARVVADALFLAATSILSILLLAIVRTCLCI